MQYHSLYPAAATTVAAGGSGTITINTPGTDGVLTRLIVTSSAAVDYTVNVYDQDPADIPTDLARHKILAQQSQAGGATLELFEKSYAYRSQGTQQNLANMTLFLVITNGGGAPSNFNISTTVCNESLAGYGR